MLKSNELFSINPSTEEIIWKGSETSPHELEEIIAKSKYVQKDWENVSLDEKQKIINTNQEIKFLLK